MKKILILLLLPFLTQCASRSTSGSSHRSASTTTLPILSNPARAQAWGAPSITKNADGYRYSYTNPANPKEKLRIFGSRAMMPFFVYPPNIKGTKLVNGVPTQTNEAQLWSKALLAGKTAKLYQSSFANADQAAEFRTLGLTLKDSSGASGQYRIEAEGTKNQVRTWLSELRFR